MKSILRFASVWAVFALLASTVLGCRVDLLDTRYLGPEETQTLTYTSGHAIQVDGVNGSLTVEAGTSTTDITATIYPFTQRTSDEEEMAKKEMDEDIHFEMTDTGSTIVIKVTRTGDYMYLGADIKVTLPSGFDGNIDLDPHNGFLDADLSGGTATLVRVRSENGDATIKGAAGTLDIVLDNGDANISVKSWSTEAGSVYAKGTGDIIFKVGAGLSGSIQAVAGSDGQVIDPDPVPADWDVDEAAVNSKTYVFGADSANFGTVMLDAQDFAFGTVTVIQQ